MNRIEFDIPGLQELLHGLKLEDDIAARRSARLQPGPDTFFLDHAAKLLVAAPGFPSPALAGVVQAVETAMLEAANKSPPVLIIRDQTTNLPIWDGKATVDCIVTRSDLNAWLAAASARYRLAGEVAPAGAPPPTKRAQMIRQHAHKWPTIARDLTDASTNGLAEAAKAGSRGWHEAAALAWARSNRRTGKAARQCKAKPAPAPAE
jgi:hypothetical protein